MGSGNKNVCRDSLGDGDDDDSRDDSFERAGCISFIATYIAVNPVATGEERWTIYRIGSAGLYLRNNR